MENIENNTSVNTESQKCELYVVSPKKFTILFLSTMGLYGIYWSYKNWSLYKSSSDSNIWPIARAFFDIFFIHLLCSKITFQTQLESEQKESSAVKWSATKYVILVIISRVFDHLANKNIGVPYSYFVSIILVPFTYQALYSIQLKINQHMEDESGSSNGDLSWVNYLWIVVGVIFWLLIILGAVAKLFWL